MISKFFLKIRQVVVFSLALAGLLWEQLDALKQQTVNRMFWGRGSLYKNSFHVIVLLISAGLLLTGILSRIAGVNVDAAALSYAYGSIGNTDLLSQGANLTAVLAVDEDTPNFRVFEHVVKAGETMKQIAKDYDLQVDTILWANSRIINPFVPEVKVGMKLSIPEIDGVLYRVRAGDSLDSILAIARGADRFSIIELNNLVPPKYTLREGQTIFIPEAELPPPEVPGLLPGYFADPLSHPECGAYIYMRGFTGYHTGVDLALGGGCPIRAIAGGVVSFAGWHDNRSGYTVIIDHGNGISSHYYHGNGEIWVKQGDFVNKGDEIMQMGSTGNSTGTHLHLTLRRNNANVNPANYVPYKRR